MQIVSPLLGTHRSRLVYAFADMCCVVLCLGLLAFGVKESAMVNKVFTCINVLVLLFVVIAGLIKGSLKNWNLNPAEILNKTTSAK